MNRHWATGSCLNGLGLDCFGAGQNVYSSYPGLVKGASELIDCATSGDDVVNEQDMVVADPLSYRK